MLVTPLLRGHRVPVPPRSEPIGSRPTLRCLVVDALLQRLFVGYFRNHHARPASSCTRPTSLPVDIHAAHVPAVAIHPVAISLRVLAEGEFGHVLALTERLSLLRGVDPSNSDPMLLPVVVEQ